MVKGVNKTVIEVNDTGSKVFDRIVFYVNPSCGNLSSKNLHRAVRNYTIGLEEKAERGYTTLRQRRLVRRRCLIAAIMTAILAVTIITLTVVL